jgi:cellulose biosynthesis protein BcsQ
VKTIAFFNNKGGVGKTSLVYHLSWMYADLGVSVIAADLDPQANLTAMFLREERLEDLWPEGDHPESILGAVSPILRGLGDISSAHVEAIKPNLGLIVGDLGLSRFEAKLSTAWPECLSRENNEAALRTESAFHRVIADAARQSGAEIVLIDVGPNLGAINRAAIIAAEHVAFPLASDLFSLQGLENLGPTLHEWRKDWRDRLERRPADRNLELPSADILPVGYIVMQHAVRADRPAKAYEKWMARIPSVYRREVLDEATTGAPTTDTDPHCLATLKHYRSLMPMAQEALKPMFHLKAADGALGGHVHAVQACYEDFEGLAKAVAAKCGVDVP